MKKKVAWIVALLLVVSAVLFAQHPKPLGVYGEKIKEYRHGVTYFNVTDMEFDLALAEYLDNHTNLVVAGMSPNLGRGNRGIRNATTDMASGDYAVVTGHHVVFREKNH